MQINWLGEFFVKFVQPHSYLWEGIWINAVTMNAAKYITLGAWIIYWLSFFLLKKTSFPKNRSLKNFASSLN